LGKALFQERFFSQSRLCLWILDSLFSSCAAEWRHKLALPGVLPQSNLEERSVRNHWRMENCLHWQLDVTLAEDASRIQKRHGGENFALLRRLALALLKRHPGKGSIRTKRYQATLDVAFLEEILKQES
jgi:predicted transposase YbfD/YdcC